jgi:hypothetical protein
LQPDGQQVSPAPQAAPPLAVFAAQPQVWFAPQFGAPGVGHAASLQHVPVKQEGVQQRLPLLAFAH